MYFTGPQEYECTPCTWHGCLIAGCAFLGGPPTFAGEGCHCNQERISSVIGGQQWAPTSYLGEYKSDWIIARLERSQDISPWDDL